MHTYVIYYIAECAGEAHKKLAMCAMCRTQWDES